MRKILFYNKFKKRVEACNKLIIKTRFCALSWLITKIILRCTVSKTSELLKSLYNYLPDTNLPKNLHHSIAHSLYQQPGHETKQI